MSKYKDILKLLQTRHPNSNVYIISDQHYSHKNMALYRKEFNDELEMNVTMIRNHNEEITDDDVVIYLGDFCFKKNQIGFINGLTKGKKYLVLGNHDDKAILKNLDTTGFLGIFESDVKIDDMVLSHHPMTDESIDEFDDKLQKRILLKEFKENDYTNYHGHIHEKNIDNDKLINVSAENISYTPAFLTKLSSSEEIEPFINTNTFLKTVELISDKKSISKELLIKDYIYAYMLQSIEKYNEDFFVNGSYGLYKKYLYQTNISDIDIGYIFDPSKSKKQQQKNLKEMCDISYDKTNEIFNTSNIFYKRSSDISIYRSNYINNNKTYVETAYDSNILDIDFFKEEDFQKIEVGTTLEKYLPYKSYLRDFEHPTATVKTTKLEGDFASLVLQYIFGKYDDNKKLSLYKKLKNFSYCRRNDEIDIKLFEDVIYRFLLRNIYFLSTFNRKEELEYVKECLRNLDELVKTLPQLTYVSDKLFDKNSKFNLVSEEINKTDNVKESIKKLIKI